MKLEGRIIFKSDQPISFHSTIEFCDNEALATCFLTIYATTDNNLLTTYLYDMKSFIFDETYKTTKYLEDNLYPLCSTSAENDYNNGEIPPTRKYVRFNFLFFFCLCYIMDILQYNRHKVLINLDLYL